MKQNLFIVALLASFTVSATSQAYSAAPAMPDRPLASQDSEKKAETNKKANPKRPASTQESTAEKKRVPKVVPNSFRRGNSDQDNALKAQKDAKLMSYSKLRKRAEKQVGGKVVSQELVRTNRNGWVYQLRMRQDNGRIKSVLVDAKTGKVLSAL